MQPIWLFQEALFTYFLIALEGAWIDLMQRNRLVSDTF
jgi:hypothetical protein